MIAIATGPNPTYSGGISHTPTSNFPNPSFAVSPTSTTAMTGGATGSPSLYSYSLGYYPNGTISSANDAANGSWAYGYDEFNRLISANENNGQQTFSYDYDRFGNRWHQNPLQGGLGTQFSFDGNNRINNPDSHVTYDALGNVLTDEAGNSYVWDAENRLVSANGNSYVYDAFGQRVKGPQGEVLYDQGGRAVTWLDATTGQWTQAEIYAGGRHLATYSGGTTNFIHPDWLGSKRVLSAMDGSTSETCTALPFGDGANCMGTNWGFSGFTDDVHDTETNTEHTLFRQLSTNQARWLTPDPYLGSMDLTNPQSLNRYAYVSNTPTTSIDPTGLVQLPGCNPDKPNWSCIFGGYDGYGGGCQVDGLWTSCSYAFKYAQTPGAIICPNQGCAGLTANGNSLYSDVHSNSLVMNCSGAAQNDMACWWSHWSKQFVENGDDTLLIGDARWRYVFDQTYRMSAGPVYGAAVGTVIVSGVGLTGIATAAGAGQGLIAPSLPAGMTQAAFGRLIGWGTGIAALSRVGQVGIQELQDAGVSYGMMLEWLQFYQRVAAANPANPSAIYRVQLIQDILSRW